MDYHVVEARHVSGHVVWLRFRDGTEGEIDLRSALRGPIFEPLHDPEIFRLFTIHPEFHTLVWPNCADFAPEFLHDNVRVAVTPAPLRNPLKANIDSADGERGFR